MSSLHASYARRGHALYDTVLGGDRPLLGVVGGTAIAVLIACGVLFTLVATRVLDPRSGLWFTATLGAVVVAIAAAGAAAYAGSGRSLWNIAFTPFAIAAGTWIPLFVLRPFELYVTPDQAVLGLAQLGFTLSDLTRSAAIGGLGVSAWCVGYLAALHGREPVLRSGVSRPRSVALSGRGAAVVIAVGTAFWLALFLRQGGPRALLESAVSIRHHQFASFYGFVGVWMVQGAALYAFLAYLQHPTKVARRTLAVSTPLALAAAIALQVRLLAAIFVIAAVAIYVAHRPITARRGIALAAVALFGLLAIGVFQQVREYSNHVDTREALRLTLRAPVRSIYGGDLTTYDHFVAMQELIPGSIGYLDGQTIGEIPVSLVPRTLWPDKPHGIDFMVSAYLYPGAFSGSPISMQGELYWNGGLVAVVLGSLALGTLLGLLTRVGLRVHRGSALFLLYATAFPFTHAFLTRALAIMFENILFALTGCMIAVAAMAAHRPRLSADGLADALRASWLGGPGPRAPAKG